MVSHWGSDFRKKYGSLGILHALLPKGTPFIAMSATLPPRVRNDILNKLQFDKNNYVNINLGNDCPNVSIVVRAIHNAMNTYSDLDFLIPTGVTKPSQVPKAFVYADNVAVGVDIEDRLYERSPWSLPRSRDHPPIQCSLFSRIPSQCHGAIQSWGCSDLDLHGCSRNGK